MLLIDHANGCTPLKPCVSCWALAFLRERLSQDDMSQLLEALGGKRTTLDREQSTDALDLSNRTRNALIIGGINTIEELIQRTKTDLIRIPNFGRKSVEEVRTKLAEYGLQLRDPYNTNPETRT